MDRRGLLLHSNYVVDANNQSVLHVKMRSMEIPRRLATSFFPSGTGLMLSLCNCLLSSSYFLCLFYMTHSIGLVHS